VEGGEKGREIEWVGREKHGDGAEVGTPARQRVERREKGRKMN
jgi:hypothetical protein